MERQHAIDYWSLRLLMAQRIRAGVRLLDNLLVQFLLDAFVVEVPSSTASEIETTLCVGLVPKVVEGHVGLEEVSRSPQRCGSALEVGLGLSQPQLEACAASARQAEPLDSRANCSC
eukprot:Skav229041  [mRNA]  locus=scaffold2828:7092:10289:+ [translate_table: standard]